MTWEEGVDQLSVEVALCSAKGNIQCQKLKDSGRGRDDENARREKLDVLTGEDLCRKGMLQVAITEPGDECRCLLR